MEVENQKHPSPPHALVLPFPAQGHIKPLMELSHCLIHHGFRITFVTTESCHQLITAAMPKINGEDGGGQIRLVAIKDGLAPGESRRDVGKLFRRISRAVPQALEELIIGNPNGSDKDDGGGNFTCIITDGSMAGAIPVAQKMGLPTVVFWPASATSLALVFQIPILIRDGIINPDGTVAKQGMVRLSRTMPEMDAAHFFWLCIDDLDGRKDFFRYLKDRSQDLKATSWILCNSFYDLEQSACELVGRVLPIGPLIEGRRHGGVAGNFWQEDSTCLSWLDQQPANSVIYVAFGSITIFNKYQFQELALGLELSGKRFLWVVRPDFRSVGGSEEEDNYYPDGFKDRVGDRGCIVEWSPQQKVLAHPAIALFFTHCGWNSIMEGLSNGVPFLCWPYFSDQLLNKAYVTDVWKAGLEVKPANDGNISRWEIERKLEELVRNKEIRRTCLELKTLARKNASNEGSSWKNFNYFIEAMKSEI